MDVENPKHYNAMYRYIDEHAQVANRGFNALRLELLNNPNWAGVARVSFTDNDVSTLKIVIVDEEKMKIFTRLARARFFKKNLNREQE